jgi:hypothetical protein
MVQDDKRVGLDGVRVVFDDDRVVSDAGIALVATVAGRLGIEALVGRFVTLRRDRPGAANPGRKVMALVFAMLLDRGRRVPQQKRTRMAHQVRHRWLPLSRHGQTS